MDRKHKHQPKEPAMQAKKTMVTDWDDTICQQGLNLEALSRTELQDRASIEGVEHGRSEPALGDGELFRSWITKERIPKAVR